MVRVQPNPANDLAIAIEQLLVKKRKTKSTDFRSEVRQAADEILLAHPNSTLPPGTVARILKKNRGEDFSPSEAFPGGPRENTRNHLDTGVREEAIAAKKVRDIDESIAKRPIEKQLKLGQTQALRRLRFLRLKSNDS